MEKIKSLFRSKKPQSDDEWEWGKKSKREEEHEEAPKRGRGRPPTKREPIREKPKRKTEVKIESQGKVRRIKRLVAYGLVIVNIGLVALYFRAYIELMIYLVPSTWIYLDYLRTTKAETWSLEE